MTNENLTPRARRESTARAHGLMSHMAKFQFEPVGSHDEPVPDEAVALAAEINAAWRETLGGVFKTGDLLIKAKATVPPGQWGNYVREHLPFGSATARRLMKIASDKKLRNESHATHLPICWFTLWELTALTEEQFERGIAVGTINPSMLRLDVERLKGSWAPGTITSPRLFRRIGNHRKFQYQYQQRGAGLDPIAKARKAYFEATCELDAEESECELAMCFAHFRPNADLDDDDD